MHRQLRILTGAAAVLLSLATVSAAAHPHGHGYRGYHHPHPPHVVTYHPAWSVCFGKHGRRQQRSGPLHHLDLCVGNGYRTHRLVGHGYGRPHWHGRRHGRGCRHW